MKFLSKSKFLWIGAFLGITAQLLGKLNGTVLGDKWGLSGLLSNLDIWPLIILLVLYRAKPTPKQMFRDLLFLFIGLDVAYYAYTSIQSSIQFYEAGHLEYLGVNLFEDFVDCLIYTIIGFAAGIWGYFMTKFRNAGRKLKYYAMVCPFFIVQIYLLISNLVYIKLLLGTFILDMLCLMVISYLYIIKSPLKNKTNAQAMELA
ncbi:MAG: hypothetical protein ACI4I6_04920 [Hominimerdicola sp.]